ncbi:MAG TPA: IgGFc-binding protein [Polyangiaceae bacterium]
MSPGRFAAVSLLLCLSACGSSGSNGASGGTPTDAGTGGDTTTRGDGGGSFGDGSSGGDATTTFGCSADLRNVVDQNGNVVQTCPDDQGCAGGQCVAACAAAAASHGSLGCDFWLATPVITDRDAVGQQQPCFAISIANGWPLAATVTVTQNGTTYDPTTFGYVPSQTASPAQWPAIGAQGVPVDGIAILYLSGAPNVNYVETGAVASCPQGTATGTSTMPTATGKYAAFHVTTSVPVTAYDIYPFGGGESGFPGAELVYPSSAWGTNYVVLATPQGTLSPPRRKFLDILADTSATTVTFSPAVPVPGGGGYPPVNQNASTMFTLDAGEYAHWETDPATTDFSGSIVLANHPVSVAAGEDLFRLQPFGEPGGDVTHVQILPTSAIAHDYAVAPYTTRRADLKEETIHYRIVGLVAGTQLSFDPAVAGAPSAVGQAQVVDFATVGAFRVTSQDASHPFSIAQEMSTGNLNMDTDAGFRTDCATFYDANQMLQKTCGDEEFVPLVPPAQFLDKYVFFTDPTYSTTTLSLVRAQSGGAFRDVTVDCLGTISGWKNVDAAGRYQYARADLVRALPPGSMPDAGACANGAHVASSKGPFGLVVYGLDTYASYAYPAGGNAAVLSGVVVQPPQ